MFSIFEKVASYYDLMNNIMSFGTQKIWKKLFIDQIDIGYGYKILDVASGTLDLGIMISKKYPSRNLKIHCVDVSKNMLLEGKKKAINSCITNLSIYAACATQLPFKNNEFDLYTVSFGIRNIKKRMNALNEAYRIIRPGGRFYCMEFSPKSNPIFLNCAYKAYSKAIPYIGKFVANDYDSYEYLVKSIENFLTPDEFVNEIECAGFINVSYKHIGIVTIHYGEKI